MESQSPKSKRAFSIRPIVRLAVAMSVVQCSPYAVGPPDDHGRKSKTVNPRPPIDVHGEPLPEGAIARLGTLTTTDVSYGNPVAFSPDGKILASKKDDTTALLWELETGKAVRKLEGPRGARADVLAFSPDGKTLASSSADGTIRLWRVDSGKQLVKFLCAEDWASSLAFSPDGKQLASGMSGGTVLIWGMAASGK